MHADVRHREVGLRARQLNMGGLRSRFYCLPAHHRLDGRFGMTVTRAAELLGTAVNYNSSTLGTLMRWFRNSKARRSRLVTVTPCESTSRSVPSQIPSRTLGRHLRPRLRGHVADRRPSSLCGWLDSQPPTPHLRLPPGACLREDNSKPPSPRPSRRTTGARLRARLIEESSTVGKVQNTVTPARGTRFTQLQTA